MAAVTETESKVTAEESADALKKKREARLARTIAFYSSVRTGAR